MYRTVGLSSTGKSLWTSPPICTYYFAREGHARHARLVGFVSKWVVHPEQIETATRVFTPTAPELDEARRILELLDTAAVAGRGATADGTSMVDEASRRAALGVLARADER